MRHWKSHTKGKSVHKGERFTDPTYRHLSYLYACVSGTNNKPHEGKQI